MTLRHWPIQSAVASVRRTVGIGSFLSAWPLVASTSPTALSVAASAVGRLCRGRRLHLDLVRSDLWKTTHKITLYGILL